MEIKKKWGRLGIALMGQRLQEIAESLKIDVGCELDYDSSLRRTIEARADVVSGLGKEMEEIQEDINNLPEDPKPSPENFPGQKAICAIVLIGWAAAAILVEGSEPNIPEDDIEHESSYVLLSFYHDLLKDNW